MARRIEKQESVTEEGKIRVLYFYLFVNREIENEVGLNKGQNEKRYETCYCNFFFWTVYYCCFVCGFL